MKKYIIILLLLIFANCQENEIITGCPDCTAINYNPFSTIVNHYQLCEYEGTLNVAITQDFKDSLQQNNFKNPIVLVIYENTFSFSLAEFNENNYFSVYFHHKKQAIVQLWLIDNIKAGLSIKINDIQVNSNDTTEIKLKYD